MSVPASSARSRACSRAQVWVFSVIQREGDGYHQLLTQPCLGEHRDASRLEKGASLCYPSYAAEAGQASVARKRFGGEENPHQRGSSSCPTPSHPAAPDARNGWERGGLTLTRACPILPPSHPARLARRSVTSRFPLQFRPRLAEHVRERRRGRRRVLEERGEEELGLLRDPRLRAPGATGARAGRTQTVAPSRRDPRPRAPDAKAVAPSQRREVARDPDARSRGDRESDGACARS